MWQNLLLAMCMQAGLVHFTRSIAPKLAGQGVRLCAVCPQPVDTPMVASMRGLGLPMPETGDQLLTPARVGALYNSGFRAYIHIYRYLIRVVLVTNSGVCGTLRCPSLCGVLPFLGM